MTSARLCQDASPKDGSWYTNGQKGEHYVKVRITHSEHGEVEERGRVGRDTPHDTITIDEAIAPQDGSWT